MRVRLRSPLLEIIVALQKIILILMNLDRRSSYADQYAVFHVFLTPLMSSSGQLVTGLLQLQCSLGLATYLEDFLPTRDRSIPGGSLLSFKPTADDDEPNGLGGERGLLKEFKVIAFGEINLILEAVSIPVGLSQCAEAACSQIKRGFRSESVALKGPFVPWLPFTKSRSTN